MLDEPTFQRELRRVTLWPALALGAVIVVLLALTLYLIRSANWVDHTDRVIAQAFASEKLAVDMETGMRAYQMTSDPAFLQPWNQARERIDPTLDGLAALVADNAWQDARVDEQRAAFQRWRAHAEQTLERVRTGGDVRSVEWNATGKTLFDSFRENIGRFISEEQRLRDGRARTLGLLRNSVLSVLALTGLIGVPLFARALRRIVERVSTAYRGSLQETQAQRDELHTSLSSIGDAVLATDAKGAIAFLNPVAEKLTGWTDAEARGRTLTEVLPIFNQQTGKPAENPVERVLRERIVIGLANHTVLRRRDGSEIPIEDSAAPIFHSDGSVRGVILVFHDVSEKYERERALREAEWLMRKALEVGGGGAWAVDFARGTVTGDAFLARSFNISPERCRAGEEIATFLAAIHEDDRELVKGAVAGSLESGAPYRVEFRALGEDGVWRWFVSQGQPEADATGRALRMPGMVFDITSQRAAEAALRDAEWLARTALEVGGAGAWVLELETGRVIGDALMARTFGVSPERCRAGEPIETFFNAVHEDDRARVRDGVTRALETGEFYVLEYRVRGEGGVERWVDGRGRVERDAAGRPVRMPGFLYDITARKVSELALRRSETNAHAIVDTAMDAVLLMDQAGNVAGWNPAAERIFGWSREEVMGLELASYIIPERLRGAHRQGLAHLLVSGEGPVFGRRLELPALRRDGTEFPAELSINPLPGSEPPLFVGFLRDISQRKSAEAELAERASLAALRADVASLLTSHDPISEVLKGCCELLVRHLEAAFARIWTLDATEPVLLLQASAGLYTHIDGPHARVPVGQFKIGRIAQNRRAHLTNDVPHDPNISDPAWAAREGMESFAGYPLIADGHVLGVLALFARHPLSEAVLGDLAPIADAISANLERRAAEAALLAEKERAEVASRAKDNFLAALSHELRTPLTPVLMTAAALREDERLPADIRAELGMIERNIALEARLIDDLLDLTRIAKGKVQLREEVCDVHSLIGLVVEIVRDEAQSKPVAIDVELTARRSGLRGDPARLQQVFWNLLRNAIKFTPTGGRISIRTRDETDERLRIEISDSGIGLDPGALETIFRPFEQAGREGDHRFGGLGLGLAIARAIVDLHGGVIRAESEGAGRGATFIVELPRVGDQATGVTLPPTRAQSDEGPEIDAATPTLRLLLVEDHEPTLAVLKRLLVRAGHQVVTAVSVASAMAAAEAGQFDVVISDLGLPDGTGLEVITKLRGVQPRLRGIALSGYGMEDDLQRSVEAGFSLHLVKPIDFNQLRRALREVAALIEEGR